MASGTTAWPYCSLGKRATNVFAVGDNGVICAITAAPEQHERGTSNLLQRMVQLRSSAFAVGETMAPSCAMTAAEWNSMASGTTYWLNAVWGSSGSDVFAVGL